MTRLLIELQEKDLHFGRELHFKNVKDSLKKYRNERSEEIKEQILRIVRIYGVRGCGILPGKLADMIGFNKKNILPYLNMLEEEKKIKRENQQAPYFPTDESYKDPLLVARLFGESSSRLLKDRRDLILTNELRTVFQRKDYPYFLENKKGKKKGKRVKVDTTVKELDFGKYKQFYLPRFTQEYQSEKNLFEFSNRIGAFITRTLIQALTQRNYSASITDLKEQQIAAQEYVNKALSTLIPSLIPAFIDLSGTSTLTNEFYQDEVVTYYGWKCLECESITENTSRGAIEQFIRDHQQKTIHTKGKWHQYKNYDHSTKNISKPVQVKDSMSILESRKKNRDGFLFDGLIIRRLEHAFSNIYPLLGYELKKIVDNMPYNKESYEKFTRDLHNKLELRRKCEHTYKEPTNTLFGYGRQCTKCNHIQKVKEILVKRKKKSN